MVSGSWLNLLKFALNSSRDLPVLNQIMWIEEIYKERKLDDIMIYKINT